MLVKELKEKLKSYGLSTVGLKQELEARLETYENELNSKDPNRRAAAVAAAAAAAAADNGGQATTEETDEIETTEHNTSGEYYKHLSHFQFIVNYSDTTHTCIHDE